ncbi:MAG TPA: DNA primase [Candidatus Paceibacterota bacterium]|nr:DNA primase [Candidatus Paceibacterota bacterium]
MDTVQQIKDRLSIVDVAGQYVKLIRAGASYKARCPFHSERTPSFVVSPSRGTYHCFGCGAGGDIFSFVEEVEGIDFRGALKILADRAGVTITEEKPGERNEREELLAACEAATVFYERQLAGNEPAKDYLRGRGIAEATIRSFRLGWAPADWRGLVSHLKEKGFDERAIERAGLAKRTEKGAYDRFRSRIMFPIADSAGRVIAFSGRIFEPAGTAHPEGQEPPKYLNSPETPLFHKSRILYGYDRAKLSIRKYDCTVLVEGQMDLVMCHQAGWTNAVAVSGTALTEEHIALIRRLSENLILALDADEAGIRAAAKSARIALAQGMDVKVAALGAKDPADLINGEGKEAFAAAIRGARHIITFLIDTLERAQPERRAFARAVERGVLPFVAAIKSPIDREHFLRETADRIGMPEAAVREALARALAELAHEQGPAPRAQEPAAAPVRRAADPAIAHAQTRQLLGIYLWQSSLPAPALDLAKLAQEIEDATGITPAIPETLSEEERESLRFAAEGLFGDSVSLAADAEALRIAVYRGRLQRELAIASSDLRRAEAAHDETAAADALSRCAHLTTAIAKIDTIR